MKCDQHGSGESSDHVEVEPMSRRPDPAQPLDALTQRIKEDHHEQHDACNPQLDGDGAAGLQQLMLGREWPFRRGQQIVVPSIDGKRNNADNRC